MIAAGPTLKVSGVISWLVLAGSVIIAIGGGWKIVWPMVTAAVKFNEVVPTLIEIGEDFKRNHGTSLRDQVDRTDKNVDALVNVTVVEGGVSVTKPVNEVLSELYRYAHDNNHLLAGRVGVIEGWQKLYDGLIKKIPDSPSS